MKIDTRSNSKKYRLENEGGHINHENKLTHEGLIKLNNRIKKSNENWYPQ